MPSASGSSRPQASIVPKAWPAHSSAALCSPCPGPPGLRAPLPAGVAPHMQVC